MINFKEETIRAIKESGHSLEDVMFIGSKNGKKRIKIEKFLEISDFMYDCGYGSAEIYSDLIIYFKDKSYIVRGEYDGSEWWEYNHPLNYNENDDFISFDNLRRYDYKDLGEED